jgi:hypothetical protein
VPDVAPPMAEPLPLPMLAFVRMKLSAFDAAPAPAVAPAAVPLVPVVDEDEALSDAIRHPVTVVDWPLRLLVVCELGDWVVGLLVPVPVPAPDGVCPAPEGVCAPTPTLSAAARTDPKRIFRFICISSRYIARPEVRVRLRLSHLTQVQTWGRSRAQARSVNQSSEQRGPTAPAPNGCVMFPHDPETSSI